VILPFSISGSSAASAWASATTRAATSCGFISGSFRRVVAALELVDADDRDDGDPLHAGGRAGLLEVRAAAVKNTVACSRSGESPVALSTEAGTGASRG
jgi:hypothetical protein